MSRINTNVNSLISQRILGQQNKTLSTSLERLSTGLRINRGADDPAGLIASEKLRSEMTAIDAAIGNAERADQVMNIAEGGLQEVNSLLIELQGLVTQSSNEAGLSREEREANQLQIDSILQTIDRISATTSFEGVKLLNGTFDFTILSQNSKVEDFQINAAKLEHDSTRNVQTIVTQSAQHAGLYLSTQISNNGLDLDDNADSRLTFEIAGAQGSREFTFASGTRLSAVASAINTFTDITGVSAAISGNNTGLTLKSTGFGSDEFVSFNLIDDGGMTNGRVFDLSANDENVTAGGGGTTFATIAEPIRDRGQDVGVTINGIAATTNGRTASINTDFLNVELTLTSGGAQDVSSGNFKAFTIEGGGAQFNLGPQVNITNQVSIGIKNVATRNLGNTLTGFLDDLAAGQSANVVDGDLSKAQKVVSKSIDQISSLRGRIGAFQQNVIGATTRSLGVALENTSAAESQIRDTDFASETAELTRSQILVNAATNVLSISNSRPQSVLSLLG